MVRSDASLKPELRKKNYHGTKREQKIFVTINNISPSLFTGRPCALNALLRNNLKSLQSFYGKKIIFYLFMRLETYF